MDRAAWLVETDGRAYRITLPNLQYNSGRGESQVGLIYDRDGYTLCAFTGRKANDLRSWCTRQHTQEETDRVKEAYLLIGVRKEDGGFGVHRQHGGKADIHSPFTEDCRRSLMQWWLEGADGAGRCLPQV